MADNKSGEKEKAGWRGKGTQAAQKTAKKQYRWQEDWTKKQDEGRQAGNRWHRIKVAFFSVTSLVLLGWFLYLILYRAPKTPIVTVAVTAYDWPLPPNAWAAEDIDQYKGLHDETLVVDDVSVHWSGKLLAKDHLRQALADIKAKAGNRPAVIMYLSLHGLVNSEGKPCFLLPPPDSNPLDEGSWLPLSELLKEIEAVELPPEIKKVLILDSNRVDINWNCGVLENSFARSLEETVKTSGIPGLAVLNSCSPGEIGWASPELRGSIFGHYVFRGLKGEADANGDTRVSMHELHAYVNRNVDQWVSENRADHQKPMLLVQDESDFELVYAYSPGWFGSASQAAVAVEPSAALKSAEQDIDLIWKRRDEVLTQDPERFAPQEWRDFEHKLLYAEKLCRSGSAYENRAVARVAELKQRAADMKVGAISARLPAFSVALSEHLHRATPGAGYAKKVHDATAAFIKSPSQASLKAAAASVAAPDEFFAPTGAVEGQHLRLLDQHLDAKVWARGADVVKKAVETRELAERVAADYHALGDQRAPDERVQYWVRTTVDAGDRLWRQAEDKLLVGDDDSVVAAGKLFDAARERFQRAAGFAKTVADALALRDQVAAELPYLAQWLTRRFPESQQALQAAADKQIQGNLLALIAETHNFSEYLEQALPASLIETEPTAEEVDKYSGDLKKRMTALQTEFQTLHNEFQKNSEYLVTRAAQEQGTMREIEAALAVPLVSAAHRKTMRATLAVLSQKLAGQQEASQTISSEGFQITSPPDDPYLKRMGAWKRHPAVALIETMVSVDTAKFPATSSREKWQEWIRDVLGAVPGDLKKAAQRLNEIENPDSILEIRRIFNRADRLARSTAPMTSHLEKPESAEQLRHFDLRQMLSWQARRTLDDFWGPPGPSRPPFFVDVAKAYLDSARSLWQIDAGARRQFDPEVNLLEARRNAVKEFISPTTQPLVLTGEESDVPHATVPAFKDGLPPGEAAIGLFDSVRKAPIEVTFDELGKVRRMPLSVPPKSAGAALRYTVARGDLGDSEFFQAQAMYRGHVNAYPFSVTHGRGVLVAVEAQPKLPPKVAVKGQFKTTASMMVIVDCSASMLAKTKDERGNEVTRMDVAKGALSLLLDSFVAADDYRIGVYFYGHRAGWSTAADRKEEEVLRRTKYKNMFPGNLMPFEDVEQVLRLGRFGAQQRREVLEVLDTVQPWGETPLYLSIRTALRDFSDSEDDLQSVIVITDGKDEVRQPTADKRVQFPELLKEAEAKKIPIQIVSFELKPDERAAANEFRQLAEKTKGAYFEAKTAADLIKALQAQLAPKDFFVRSQGGQENTGRIHTSIDLPIPAVRTNYQVEMKVRDGSYQAPIELEGGEGIELFISRSERTLINKRYGIGNPLFTANPIVDPLGSGKYDVGVHRPAFRPWPGKTDKIPHFLISLQNDDEKLFSPRPVEAWVEITPKYPGGVPDDPGLPEKFTFYDLQYAPYTPVPVLTYAVPEWPSSAKKAEVSVFWKLKRKTPPDAEVVVETAKQQPAAERTIKGSPKSRYQVFTKSLVDGGFRVGVILNGPDVENVKVLIEPDPKVTFHRVDRKNELAVHNFDFPTAKEADVLKSRLLFFTKTSLEQGSLSTSEPLVVDVVDYGDLYR